MPVVRELTELPAWFSRDHFLYRVHLDPGVRLFKVNPRGITANDYRKMVELGALDSSGHETKKGKIFYLAGRPGNEEWFIGDHPILKLYVDHVDGIEPTSLCISDDSIFRTSIGKGVPYDQGLHRTFLEVRKILSNEVAAAA